MLITKENMDTVRHALRGWTTAVEVAERTDFTVVEASALLIELMYCGKARSKETITISSQGKRKHVKAYTWI